MTQIQLIKSESLSVLFIPQGFLQLSSVQRSELVRLRSACLGSLSSIIEERNNIHAFLTVSCSLDFFASDEKVHFSRKV